MEEVKVGNKTVRARQYPWGVVQGKLEQERHTLNNILAVWSLVLALLVELKWMSMTLSLENIMLGGLEYVSHTGTFI